MEIDDGRFVGRLSRCSPTRSMRYTTLPLAASSWARASFRRIACTAPGVRRIALAISLAVRPSWFSKPNIANYFQDTTKPRKGFGASNQPLEPLPSTFSA